MTILIKAQHHSIAHKMEGAVPRSHLCYWTVGSLPAERNEEDIEMVAFTNGEKVIAIGKYLGSEEYTAGGRERKRLKFGALVECNIPLEVKPASRGWKYIDDQLILKYFPGDYLHLPYPTMKDRGLTEETSEFDIL